MSLEARYADVRRVTSALVTPLSAEDACVQSMADTSPAKWHLAHTTWFFETIVIEALFPSYRSPFARFRTLFNSYYQGIGPQFTRAERGLLTRPSLAEVTDYRAAIDARIGAAFRAGVAPRIAALIELGISHEQQHQELVLMDIKHLFACNPLEPCYHADAPASSRPAPQLGWREYHAGLQEFGAAPTGFAFDNERPRHRVFVAPFKLADRLITNGDYLEFIMAGGYRDPRWWLADGWAAVQREGWCHPNYWLARTNEWFEFTLGGVVALDLHAPVCHVSYYEADAYARWTGARLPTEFEWELAAGSAPMGGNFLDSGRLHPNGVETLPARHAPAQLFGDVWEWTSSAYAPYPGFQPLTGAVGEYNGKFMSNQNVLRGGACVTPQSHIRATYRNFFYPHQRWQFSGIRLAQDV